MRLAYYAGMLAAPVVGAALLLASVVAEAARALKENT